MGDMTVAENISLADLPVKRGPGFPVVDDRTMRERSRALLDQLGFASIDADTLVKRLSVAEQRIVEIARALAGKARVLVMDEPTAALTEQETKLIFRIIHRLKEQQVAVVYISHYLNEVFEISDRIAVLRDGRNAGLFETANASRATVLAAMLGTRRRRSLRHRQHRQCRRGGPHRHRPLRPRQSRRHRSLRTLRRDRRRLRPDRLRHRDARPRHLRCPRPRHHWHGAGRRRCLSSRLGARRQGARHRLRRRRPQARGHHRRPDRPREHGRPVPGALRPRPVRVEGRRDRRRRSAGSIFSASARAGPSR